MSIKMKLHKIPLLFGRVQSVPNLHGWQVRRVNLKWKKYCMQNISITPPPTAATISWHCCLCSYLSRQEQEYIRASVRSLYYISHCVNSAIRKTTEKSHPCPNIKPDNSKINRYKKKIQTSPLNSRAAVVGGHVTVIYWTGCSIRYTVKGPSIKILNR